MEKQIKINESTFLNIVKLLWELESVGYESDFKKAVQTDINQKLEKVQARIEYEKNLKN